MIRHNICYTRLLQNPLLEDYIELVIQSTDKGNFIWSVCVYKSECKKFIRMYEKAHDECKNLEEFMQEIALVIKLYNVKDYSLIKPL